MIRLRDVTIAVMDGGPSIELTKEALKDTLAVVEPDDVLVFSPSPEGWPDGARWHEFKHANSQWGKTTSHGVGELLWYTVPDLVRTNYFFHVSWRGWVVNPEIWDDDWKRFDYLGPPWPWSSPGKSVGCGMALRSRRLMQYVGKHHPLVPESPGDFFISVTCRPSLEAAGFKWGTEEAAHRWGVERCEFHKAFLFHGLFLWPKVMDQAAFGRRVRLGSGYDRSHPEWHEMMTIADGVYGMSERA